jgi:DNA-binding MarR family transcriptional regulator
MKSWLLDDDSIVGLLRRAAASIASQVGLRLQAHGLTHAQWLPLLLLQHKRASSNAELASILQIDHGAMTRTLDRLEAKGFCRRNRSARDRRVVDLELTAEGLRALERTPDLMDGINEELLQGFTRDEAELLRKLLKRILGNGAGPATLLHGERSQQRPTSPHAGAAVFDS